jgi:hypothetical protein
MGPAWGPGMARTFSRRPGNAEVLLHYLAERERTFSNE